MSRALRLSFERAARRIARSAGTTCRTGAMTVFYRSKSPNSALATCSRRGGIHSCCIGSHAAGGGSIGSFALCAVMNLRAKPVQPCCWFLHGGGTVSGWSGLPQTPKHI